MNQLNVLSNATHRISRWFSTGLLSSLLLASAAVTRPIFAETSALSTPAADMKVEWRTDLDATLAEAQSQNKLVLLRFTADWCPPCRVMDARVWPDSAVQAALVNNYLIVKSDVDVEASQVIARKYGVQAVPTLIVLDGNGTEIDRGGFMSSQQLIKFLDAAATTKDESDEPANVSS